MPITIEKIHGEMIYGALKIFNPYSKSPHIRTYNNMNLGHRNRGASGAMAPTF